MSRTLKNVIEEFVEEIMTSYNETNVQGISEIEHFLMGLQPDMRVPSDLSDGHHTFEELYQYRMVYNMHAAHGWLAAGVPVVKSWNHSDGEPCFGGGWFTVQAELPTGQVSNHYREKYWDLFRIPEVDRPPTYDDHDPEIVAERLRDAVVLAEEPREALELLESLRLDNSVTHDQYIQLFDAIKGAV